MKFASGEMSIYFWLIPMVLIVYYLANRMREKYIKKFIDENLSKEIIASHSQKRIRVKEAIIIASIFFSVMSLMRPQWGFEWTEVKRRGIDIMLALDTSNSMLAEDVLPNRLKRAKLAITDLIKKLNGDRVGLIVFSGKAFLQCPLTLDYNGFLLSLDDVNIDSISTGGTSLSEAIYTASKSYEGEENDIRILVIITDGEDLEGGLDQAIVKAKSQNIEIFCVGIGSEEGELIPIRSDNGNINFLKDTSGNIVKTKLLEENLKKIAFETGGMYVHATGAEFGLDLIYEKRLSKLEKKDFEAKMEKHYFDRFQYFVSMVFLLLFIEPLIGDRRRKKNGSKDI